MEPYLTQHNAFRDCMVFLALFSAALLSQATLAAGGTTPYATQRIVEHTANVLGWGAQSGPTCSAVSHGACDCCPKG